MTIAIEIETKTYALVADYNVLIINVTDPSNPAIVGNLGTNFAVGVSALKIRGKNYAFVTDYAEGLIIIEVTDPLKQAVVGKFIIK